MKRKIAAIIAADVVGYSMQIARDEEGTLKRLQSCRSVFDEFVEKYEGRIFNTAGDSILAEFASAVEAVRCALEIQESLRTKNLTLGKDEQMQFRMGINLGDVVERQGDLLGDGVNIAARLEALSSPGGICISRAIYEQVQNKVSIGFADLGPQTLKNLPTPIHTYVVTSGDAPAPPPMGLQRNLQLAIAVGLGCLVLVVGVAWWAQTRATPMPEAAEVASPAVQPPSVERSAQVAPASGNPGVPVAPTSDPKASPSNDAEPKAKTAVPAAPAEPTPATVASGDYVAAMSCEKLPWTNGVLYQEAAINVSGTVLRFTRDIHWPDRNGPVIGIEVGKGEITAAGVAFVDAAWGSATNSYAIRYEGNITASGGTMKGLQNWIREGRKFVRACELVLRRK